jgi:hypothetical protein
MINNYIIYVALCLLSASCNNKQKRGTEIMDEKTAIEVAFSQLNLPTDTTIEKAFEGEVISITKLEIFDTIMLQKIPSKKYSIFLII